MAVPERYAAAAVADRPEAREIVLTEAWKIATVRLLFLARLRSDIHAPAWDMTEGVTGRGLRGPGRGVSRRPAEPPSRSLDRAHGQQQLAGFPKGRGASLGLVVRAKRLTASRPTGAALT